MLLKNSLIFCAKGNTNTSTNFDLNLLSHQISVMRFHIPCSFKLSDLGQASFLVDRESVKCPSISKYTDNTFKFYMLLGEMFSATLETDTNKQMSILS